MPYLSHSPFTQHDVERPKGGRFERKEVIFVSVLLEHPRTEVTRMPMRSYVTELVTGIVGVLAAAVGAWMYYVPTDWFLGGLAEAWYFGLFIGAGALLALAFGLYARKAYVDDHMFTTRVTTFTVLSLAALAAAITFAVILII